MKKLALLLGGLALLAFVPAQAAKVDPAAPALDGIPGVDDTRIDPGLMPGGYASYTCGGTAPASTSCTTGHHMRTGPGWFGAGTGAGCSPPPVNTCQVALPGYTGTLYMNIIYYLHDAGPFQTRSQVCDVVGGTFLGCRTVGVNPPAVPPTSMVNIYDHTCTSNNLGSATPGGSGAWACFTYHNVSPAGLFG